MQNINCSVRIETAAGVYPCFRISEMTLFEEIFDRNVGRVDARHTDVSIIKGRRLTIYTGTSTDRKGKPPSPQTPVPTTEPSSGSVPTADLRHSRFVHVSGMDTTLYLQGGSIPNEILALFQTPTPASRPSGTHNALEVTPTDTSPTENGNFLR